MSFVHFVHGIIIIIIIIFSTRLDSIAMVLAFSVSESYDHIILHRCQDRLRYIVSDGFSPPSPGIPMVFTTRTDHDLHHLDPTLPTLGCLRRILLGLGFL